MSITCLFGLALRQSLVLVESLLRLADMGWRAPDFSIVSRHQLRLPYRPAFHALDLLGDSTGAKFLGESKWTCKKHGAEYRRQWHKVQLGIDAHTLAMRTIEVTHKQAQRVIPPRKNAKPWKETLTDAAIRNETLRAYVKPGRRI